MALKLLIIGDPHFKGDNAIDTQKLQEEVLRLIELKQCNACIVLGDLMHDHGTAKMKVFNRACDFLIQLTRVLGRENVFVLIGNHDRINNKVSEGDEHFFRLFKRDHPDFPIIVDQGQLIEIEKKRFALLQYVEPGLLHEHIDKLLRTSEKTVEDIDAFFLHQELLGCDLGTRTSTVGDPWPLTYPLAISGHIHKYHNPQQNLIYPGTPFQTNFGENQWKAVMVMTYQTGSRQPEIERAQLDIPDKIALTLSCRDFIEFDVTEDSWIKFKIKDERQKIKALKASDKYNQVRLMPLVRFTFTSLEDEPKKIDLNGPMMPKMTKVSFLERLEKVLSEQNPGMKDLFERDFLRTIV